MHESRLPTPPTQQYRFARCVKNLEADPANPNIKVYINSKEWYS